MDTISNNKVVGSMRLVWAYLKWSWDLLFHLSFFHHRHSCSSYGQLPAQDDFNDIVLATAEDLRHSSECSVCLSEVEEGDEIRELTCRHVFHKVCLDRWTSSFTSRRRSNPTCPLCRRSLITQEVVVFDYASFVSSDRDTRDTWWLR